jgi:carbon storage regulator
MLVLSRKVGEKVRIGRNIFVTVVRCQDGKVRLGFEAPTELPVVRTEIDGIEEAPAGSSPCPMDACSCPLGQCRLNESTVNRNAS